MSDWFDDESDEAPPPKENEGVRVLGDGDEPRPRPPVREPGRPVREDDPTGPTWSAGGAVPPADPGEVPAPLPHWTEPPTGQSPRILGDEAAASAPDEDPWSTLGGGSPRFRTGTDDWGESDFSSSDLKDDSIAVGALAEPEDDFDDDVAGRRGGRRARRRGGGGGGGAAGFGDDWADDLDETAVEPEAHPPADVTTRVVTAAVVAVVAIACLWAGRGPTAILAAAIVGVAAFEVYQGFRTVGFKTATALGLIASVALVLASYKRGEAAYPLITALLVLFTFLWYMAEVVKARAAVNIGMTLLGYGYVGVFGGFAGLMLASPNGVGLILGVAICAIGYDVVGYFVGRSFGRSKLAPRLSPNKTYEGLFAGMAASVVLGGIVSGVLGITPWDSFGHGLALGVVVAVIAPLGDLCESMLKRDLQIKDFGSILPGHGGVLDRFDAILVCLPAVYYLARALEIG